MGVDYVCCFCVVGVVSMRWEFAWSCICWIGNMIWFGVSVGTAVGVRGGFCCAWFCFVVCVIVFLLSGCLLCVLAL